MFYCLITSLLKIHLKRKKLTSQKKDKNKMSAEGSDKIVAGWPIRWETPNWHKDKWWLSSSLAKMLLIGFSVCSEAQGIKYDPPVFSFLSNLCFSCPAHQATRYIPEKRIRWRSIWESLLGRMLQPQPHQGQDAGGCQGNFFYFVVVCVWLGVL